MNRPTHCRSRRRGSVLLASLSLVTLVAMLGAGLVRMQVAATRRHSHSIDVKRSLYVAEAGLAEAFSAIAVGKSGTVGSDAEPARFGQGVFWVEAEEDMSGRIDLVSTGLCGAGRFSIEAVVQRTVNPATVNGVFGDQQVRVRPGAVVDGYDSRLGDYESQVDPTWGTTGEGARLTSNADVVLESESVSGSPDTLIFGDVRTGPSGVVESGPGVLVTGSTSPLAEAEMLPGIPVPDIPTSQGTLTTDGLELAGDDLRYDKLHVLAGSTLRLVGPLALVVDDLEVDSTGRIEIDGTAGTVTLYVLKSLRMRAGSELETVHDDPARTGFFLGELAQPESTWVGIKERRLARRIRMLQWLVGILQASLEDTRDLADYTWQAEALRRILELMAALAPSPDPALVFEPAGTFHGLLYGPFEDLTVPPDLRLLGAVAGKSVTLAEGARVTFDRGLVAAGLSVEGLPELVSWRIVALPQVPLVHSGLDPLVKLKLDGVTPKPSADSHREQGVSLEYLDKVDNQKKTFVGTLVGMDWTNVQRVRGVQWQDPSTGLYSEQMIPVGVLSGDGSFLVLETDGGGSFIVR